LDGGLVVAAKAFIVGATARERTVIVNDAQGHMEELRAFRDNRPWDKFLYGVSGTYAGVLNAGAGSPDCVVRSPCFHMALPGGPSPTEHLPAGDHTGGSVPTSYIEIYAEPEPGPGTPQYVDFTLSYGFDGIGGSVKNVGHIQTRLTNLRFAVAPVAPAPPGPPGPAPACVGDGSDIAMILDASGSMNHPWLPSAQPKSTEVVNLAKTFINNSSVSPTGNHEAIIQFNDNAALLLAGLSGNPLALTAAINAYSVQTDTYFLPSFQMAYAQLTGGASRAPGAPKRIVFISDAESVDDGNIAAMQAYVDDLKNNKGVTVYSIAVTSTTEVANQALMQSLASPGKFVDAADSAAVAGALDSIAAEVCGP
jgi:hypothetical protein